jgi:hypothetical protein
VSTSAPIRWPGEHVDLTAAAGAPSSWHVPLQGVPLYRERASGQQREGWDVARADDVEVTMVERCHLGDAKAFGDRDHGGIGRAEREVGVRVDQFSHALVVEDLEVDDSECLLGDRAEKCALDLRSAGAAEEVADLGHNGCRDEDRAAREVQAREQVRAGAVVGVAPVRRGDERAGVADDHSGVPEAVGEQIVMIATEIGPSALERPEPGRGPLDGRLEFDLASSLGEDGRHPVVGKVLDQLLQLIALGAHDPQGTGGATRPRDRRAPVLASVVATGRRTMRRGSTPAASTIRSTLVVPV